MGGRLRLTRCQNQKKGKNRPAPPSPRHARHAHSGFEVTGLEAYDDADQVSGGRISMRQTALLLIVIASIILVSTPVFAQHTLAAKFDLTKSLTLKGTVTQIDWSNPYVHIIMK